MIPSPRQEASESETTMNQIEITRNEAKAHHKTILRTLRILESQLMRLEVQKDDGESVQSQIDQLVHVIKGLQELEEMIGETAYPSA